MTSNLAGLTPTQAYISLRSYMNPQGPTQQPILNYSSGDALTAQASAVQTITIPPSTPNYQVTLASLFPAFTLPIFVSVADISNPGVGFTWSTVSAGVQQVVGPNGWLAWMPNAAGSLSPLYISNISTSYLVLSIGVMSN